MRASRYAAALERQRDLLAVAAHPTDLPGGHAHHERVIRHFGKHHGTGADEGMAADRDAAQDGAVGSERAPVLTSVGRYSPRRLIAARGLATLVKTTLGPQNTSCSSVTPSYIETLFWILQPSPTTALPATKQFWPSDTFRPIRAPAETWQKCQTREPSPILAPGSTIAEG